MSKTDIIVEKWKNGEKQVDIAKDLGVGESYISHVLAPLKSKKSIPKREIYPHIVYIALKHYKRTWFKNRKPEREGKMMDEWNSMDKILKTEI